MIAFNFKGLHYIDDEIVMGEEKSGVMKNDGGNKKYLIYLSKEHDFTHTIEDESVKYTSSGEQGEQVTKTMTFGMLYSMRKRKHW